MKKVSYSLMMLAAVGITFSSCSKDEDTEKPNIEAVTLESKWAAAGDEIGLDLVFTDNKGLKEYKIDIHDDFDGHSHGKTASYEKFETVVINQISGLSFDDHVHIDVPANAMAGPYHVGVYVLDQDGNQSNTRTLTVYITNSGMANINVTNMSETAENDATPGSNVTLEGTITAGIGNIEEIVVSIKKEDDHSHGKVADGDDEIFEWDQDFATPVASWDFADLGPIAIPANANGHYELEVWAKDVDGNIAVKHYEMHIE